MNNILRSYIERLLGATQETLLETVVNWRECIYSPNSLRAPAATVLLDHGVPIWGVQELLDHQHITTTQIYDKRRRLVKDSASHKVPIWANYCESGTLLLFL